MTMKKTSGTTPATPVKWNFTTYTDAKGRTYVITYHNRWDSKKKQSRVAARRHVGRLDSDTGEVALSKPYLADHPEYDGEHVFYEANSLVVRSGEEAGKIREEAAGAAEWRCGCVSVGLTWALWRMAEDSGILASLQGVFGADDGAEMLRLGIYELCSGGGAMQNYGDWLAENYLPGAAPLDGWRISRLLASVSQERIDAYFKDRYESIMERRRQAGLTGASGRPMLMAVDSTGISTWSETIGDAAHGHAKQDPFLKQVNLTICVDYETGDACYAYISEGSVNDMSLFPELLMRMQSAGFDLSEVLIVTDRGYSSMQNVQKQLNCGIKFLTGIRLSEDSIRRQIDKYGESLRNMAFLNGAMGVYARSAEPERWTSYGDGIMTGHSVHVHLYRNPILEAEQTLAFQCELEALLKARNAGRAVDASKWSRYRKFLVEPAQGSDKWTVRASAVQKANRYNGCFAIRTNVVADPFEALAIYNERGIVESAFRQFKVLDDGRRLMATEASYKGRILLHLLAQGLRMMAMVRLQNKNNSLKGKLPGDSLVKAMWILRRLQASRPAGRGAWLTKELPRSTRELLQALGVGLPGRILKD